MFKLIKMRKALENIGYLLANLMKSASSLNLIKNKVACNEY